MRLNVNATASTIRLAIGCTINRRPYKNADTYFIAAAAAAVAASAWVLLINSKWLMVV